LTFVCTITDLSPNGTFTAPAPMTSFAPAPSPNGTFTAPAPMTSGPTPTPSAAPSPQSGNFTVSWFSGACGDLSNSSIKAVNPVVGAVNNCSLLNDSPISAIYIIVRACGEFVDFDVFMDSACSTRLYNQSGLPSGSCIQGSFFAVSGSDFFRFDCSSAPPTPGPPPGKRVDTQMTFYSDANCGNLVNNASLLSANPVRTSSDTCTSFFADGGNYYLKAASCGVDATVTAYRDSQCQTPVTSFTYGNGTCSNSSLPPFPGVQGLTFVCTITDLSPNGTFTAPAPMTSFAPAPSPNGTFTALPPVTSAPVPVVYGTYIVAFFDDMQSSIVSTDGQKMVGSVIFTSNSSTTDIVVSVVTYPFGDITSSGGFGDVPRTLEMSFTNSSCPTAPSCRVSFEFLRPDWCSLIGKGVAINATVRGVSTIIRAVFGFGNLTAVDCKFAASYNSQPASATVKLMPVNNSGVSGTVTFYLVNGALSVRGNVSGLSRGSHGIHVHSFGDVRDTKGALFTGMHFAFEGQVHGLVSNSSRHTGDLGNIVADENGNSVFIIKVPNDMNPQRALTLLAAAGSAIGRSIIVHAAVDDGITQPTGNSGSRVAQGVIGYAQYQQPPPEVVADGLCNNGQGCVSGGDILAQCKGSDFPTSTLYLCECSSKRFIAPLCISAEVQQLAVLTQAQQFSGTSTVAQFLSRQAECAPGLSLCPARPPSSETQQAQRLLLLKQELDDLLQQQARILSDFNSLCKSRNRCPDRCPASCNITSTTACPDNCPVAACIECNSQFNFISNVNASIAQVQISINRTSNELPPDPSLIFSNSSNKCVTSIVECYNTTSSTALINAVRSEAQFCTDSGLKLCPLLGCVPLSTPCIPLNNCPIDRPQRCPFVGFKDGRPPCIFSNETCANVDSMTIISVLCPVGQKPCPNGLQCAEGDGQSPSFFRVRFRSHLFDAHISCCL
jgi:Cu-Zn family superoxide dismutase